MDIGKIPKQQIMEKNKLDKIVQKEFFFGLSPHRSFISAQSSPHNLGQLPVTVLELTARARRWLRTHKIMNLDQLIEAEKNKVISQQCLDNYIRKELHHELKYYWTGKKFRYILAVNFLDHGVEKALSQSKVRKAPLKRLPLSRPLQSVLQKKRIQTIGQLFLQEELKWRNPRSIGNILVNEILIALSTYLNKLMSTERT